MNQAHTHEESLSKDFSIKKSIQYGWSSLKKYTGTLVGAVVLVMLASFVFAAIGEMVDNVALSALVSFGSYIIQAGLALGLMYIALEIYHGRSVGVDGLLTPFDNRIWSYIIASIIYGLMVAIGTLLLIIPGIWAALTFAFFPYPIIEEKLGPIEALKRSKEITEGAKLQLLLFFVVISLLNMIGALLLVVGLLATAPIAAMATVSVYYILKEATDNTAPPAEENPINAPPAESDSDESQEHVDEYQDEDAHDTSAEEKDQQ